MTEQPAPYGSGGSGRSAPAAGGAARPRRVRIPHLHQLKADGQRSPSAGAAEAGA